MDDVSAARVLLRCIDLTSLGDNDTEYSIEDLCEKAFTPYGNVASVCVFPKFVSLASHLLSKNDVKVATVVNFPNGGFDIEKTIRETYDAIDAGADEIDAVFPYAKFLEKDYDTCEFFIKELRLATKGKQLKIILETGELAKSSVIANASKLCILNGVNFIKTSTGKTKVGATPEAANVILETISTAPRVRVGFKASGGVKTIDDAKKYLILAHTIMGGKYINPSSFRIGASSLLDDLLNVIKRGY